MNIGWYLIVNLEDKGKGVIGLDGMIFYLDIKKFDGFFEKGIFMGVDLIIDVLIIILLDKSDICLLDIVMIVDLNVMLNIFKSIVVNIYFGIIVWNVIDGVFV